MKDIHVKVENISKIYGKKYVLRDVSFEIQKGEIYGLIGKNGAGKSTIMKILSGLIKQNDGNVEILGFNSKNLDRAREKMGCLVDRPYYIPQMSVYDNLKYAVYNRGLDNFDKIDDIIDFVGLNDAGSKIVSKFSLGMQQRLALAIALISEPDLLILDEPINGLDPIGIKEIRDLIKKINRERQTTVLISSHILSELYQVATRFGFIDQGELINEISREELDLMLRSYIKLSVSDNKKALVILGEELNINNYRVVEDGSIEIYDDIDTGKLMKTLINSTFFKRCYFLFSFHFYIIFQFLLYKKCDNHYSCRFRLV